VRPPARVPRARDYLQLLGNAWIVIVLTTALSAGAGWVGWMTKAPVYSSTARVFATTKGSATPADAYYGNHNSVQRTLTIRSLARSPQVTVRTIDQLGLHDTPDDLASRIAVSAGQTAVMDVVVTGEDPTLTRRTANAVAANMMQLTREMGNVDTSNVDLALVDSAAPAERQGQWWKFLLTGGGLGLAISAVLVLGYGLIRNKTLGRRHVDHVVAETIAGRLT
jgi:capsular polysaccharide biosynthesis protein